MPSTIITVVSQDTQPDLERRLIADTGNRIKAGDRIESFFRQVRSGFRGARVSVGVNAGVASGTITLTAHVATNTVTINGVVFTAVASGATGNQYNVGTDAVTGDNLAAAINASVTAKIPGYVSAVSSGTGVVTVSSVLPGLNGNLTTLAISANGTVSGATLTGGDNGAVQRTHFYGSAT